MFWPDTGTGVDVEPARKPVAAAVRKFFTEGGVGVPPTVPGGDWFNQITSELLNVLAAAGIDPSKADDDQIVAAIKSISNDIFKNGLVNVTPTFNTVEDMKNFPSLRGSKSCNTLGYYSAGDGGGASYQLSTSHFSPDGYVDHELQDGVFALLSAGGIVNVLQCGAMADGTFDNFDAFTYAKLKGNGFAFIPFVDGSFLVNVYSGSFDGLYGFYPATFSGVGLVRYNDLSQYDAASLTAANIAHRLSNGDVFNIACFGDSTMFGYKVGGETNETQDPNNPPFILGATLGHIYGFTGMVINAAISGTNLNGMLRGTDRTMLGVTYEHRIAPGGIASSAEVIYCNHGINNCQENFTVDEFKKDYVEFVRITRKYGKVPILVTPNPLLPIVGGDSRKSTQIAMFAQAVRDVATATGCDLVDNYYYAQQSSLRYSLTSLVPDGIHPSTELYKQNGRNMAIPLVSAHFLVNEGDIASLAGSSYRDTQSSNIQERSDTRTGLSYIADRTSIMTGLTMAVVFDKPFELISFMGLKWPSGARVITGVFDNPGHWGVLRCGSKYGDLIDSDWDSEYAVRANCLAGLQPIYWMFDMTDSRQSNKTSAFSGLTVPRQGGVSGYASPSMDLIQLRDAALKTNYAISFYANLAPNDSRAPIFKDSTGLDTLKIYINSAGDMIAELRNSEGLVETTTISSSEPSGKKLFNVAIYSDSVSIQVRREETGELVGGYVQTTETVPLLYLSFPFVPYTINPAL